jgi:hypothetical protein
LQKGTEVIVPEIETDRTLKKQTVALAHIRRDNRSNEITTGEEIANKETKEPRLKEIINKIVTRTLGIIQETKISHLKGTTEHATFVKIEAISKEHAENTKDGVPKVQGQPKP